MINFVCGLVLGLFIGAFFAMLGLTIVRAGARADALEDQWWE